VTKKYKKCDVCCHLRNKLYVRIKLQTGGYFASTFLPSLLCIMLCLDAASKTDLHGKWLNKRELFVVNAYSATE
jgi:hypothetical protein